MENEIEMNEHFDDGKVKIPSSIKLKTNENETEIDVQSTTVLLNYTRDQLLKWRSNIMASMMPNFVDILNEADADEKCKKRIRYILKSSMINHSNNNNHDPMFDGNAMKRPQNAAEKKNRRSGQKSVDFADTVSTGPNEDDRIGFQQMIAAAMANNQAPNYQSNNGTMSNNRRRIGSGRIIDSVPHNAFNQFVHRSGSRFYNQPTSHENNRNYGNENRFNYGSDNKWRSTHSFDMHESSKKHHDDGRSDGGDDEPEWMKCGPISKHDVIELHGFDGPQDDDSHTDHKKRDSDAKSTQSVNSLQTNVCSPPARSTPTKAKQTNESGAKGNDYFNFEDFLKMDLPSNGNAAKEINFGGESRFTRWFHRENSPKGNPLMSNPCTTEQFFELMQKSNGKNAMPPPPTNLTSSSVKFRSVEELEADWVPPNHQSAQSRPPKKNNGGVAFRKMLNQMNSSNQTDHGQGTPINIFDLINRNAQELLQYQLAQQIILKRPEAQILLQRLANNEISKLHILQLLSNPNTNVRDRETLVAVINVCNESQRLIQQQQQFGHLQNIHTSFQPQRQLTPQELQMRTQAILQNAVLKKQFGDQYRKNQGPMKPFPMPPMKPMAKNNFYPEAPHNGNFNYHQMPKAKMNQMAREDNGFTFGQGYHQSNNLSMSAMHSRPNFAAASQHNASMPTNSFTETEAPAPMNGNDFIKSQAIPLKADN